MKGKPSSRFRYEIVVLAIAALCGGCIAQISGRRQLAPEERAGIAQVSRAIRARMDAARTLRKQGKVVAAEDAYKSMLADKSTSNDVTIKLEYADLMESEGRASEAMRVVRPLIFTGARSSNFEAVCLYEKDLRATEGPAAVKAFRDKIRKNMLDGLSLEYYNKHGLTDDQAMVFIAGGFEEGKGHFAEAERIYMKIVPEYPPSELLVAQMRLILSCLHRENEIKPLVEAWYLHSSPEMKATIKRHYALDYKRLDALTRP